MPETFLSVTPHPAVSPRLARRACLKTGALSAALASVGMLSVPLARAQFRVEISGVGATQIPVAVVPFRNEARAPESMSAIVKADLERCGLFRTTDTSALTMDETVRPELSDWRGRSVDGLLAGSVTPLADGRYDIRYRISDVVKNQVLEVRSLVVSPADLRLAAHRIADEFYERMTGERGAFATRIAYVSKAGRTHVLWVADSDGKGEREALTSREPIISPAWSSDGSRLAYVSFEGGKASVMTQELTTGRRRVVASFRGTNSAPSWAPDGRRLVVTLSRDGGSQLYVLDADGGTARRLTSSGSIDTEAAWSADGSSIYFVSDRGGSPQVYRMPVAGGSAQRVTFQGGYNISPALSPDGRWLSYIGQVSGGGYRVHLMELSSGAVTVLTDSRQDESPSFAPNSRQLIYATRSQGRGVLMTTTLDGRIKATLDTPQADVREPVWGPDPMRARR